MAVLLLVWWVFLAVLNSCVWSESTRLLSVRRDGFGRLQVVEDWVDGAVVYAEFTNEISTTGWSFLKIEGNPTVDSDTELALAAGMAEGAATAELIQMQWVNTLSNFCTNGTCEDLSSFLEKNAYYNELMIDAKAKTDPFWYQMHLFNVQLQGLMLGYSSAKLGPPFLGYDDLFLMQIGGDIDSLLSAFPGSKQPGSEIIGAGKCSALVKLLPDNAELYVSHDTWDTYQSMLRIYKLYDLNFKTLPSATETIPGHRVSFSSYPGVLLSGDDFYQLSSKLVTTETTNGNYNLELWKKITPQCVLEAFRNVVANRLATSGEEWCKYFSMYNSGTYNNQWMVVDYNRFRRGQTELQNGLLWVLEQLPGTIHMGDQTDMLREKSYWPSFNIPYYADIYNESGCAELADEYGSWFTWTGTPRAQIFARNHSDVIDMTSMIKLMRYNNFQHDPLARCSCSPPYSGENGISARSDLNPANGTYPFGALAHRCHGGTDNKVTSSRMMDNVSSLACKATSGPTHQQQPVFQWSTSGFPQPLGHPDKWDFVPVLVSW